jgi:hypothetical protein
VLVSILIRNRLVGGASQPRVFVWAWLAGLESPAHKDWHSAVATQPSCCDYRLKGSARWLPAFCNKLPGKLSTTGEMMQRLLHD